MVLVGLNPLRAAREGSILGFYPWLVDHCLDLLMEFSPYESLSLDLHFL
jgi:hypothetical protein